jgi:hypothetical protein
MTASEILLMTGAYFLALLATIYFTRASLRRVAAALAGGAVASLVVLAMMVLAERVGWWRIPHEDTPYFVPLLYLGLVVSSAPIYLVTWRVVRRFGWRGLAVFVGAVAVIGPPRDYFYAAKFPEWMVFAPGYAPVIADAATYVAIVVVGHAVMQLFSVPLRDRNDV